MKLDIASLRRVSGASASAFALIGFGLTAAVAAADPVAAPIAAPAPAAPISAPAQPQVVAQQDDASPAPAAPDAQPSTGATGGVDTNTRPQTNSSGLNKSLQDRPTAAAPAPFTGLFGDFGNGERSKLRDMGILVNAHFVTEAAANITGGYYLGGNSFQRAAEVSSEFGEGLDLDFAKLLHAKGAGTLHVLVTHRFGRNLAAEALGSLVSVQEIYGDGQTTRFTYLDYEQPLFNNKLNLVFGKYNQQSDFIAGPTYWGGNLYCFFQNNNICGTPAAIPIDNGIVPRGDIFPGGTEGYNYYPSSMYGARLRLNVNKDFYIQAAALQGNQIVNNPGGGLYFGFYGAQGTELPAEAGFTFRDADGNPNGDFRFGGYYDTSNVINYTNRLAVIPGNPSNAAALNLFAGQATQRGRLGGDVQFDHIIAGSAQPGKTGTAFFATGEVADPQTALITSMFDAGIVRHGTFVGRPLDTLAVGYAQEYYNPRIQNLERSLQSLGYATPVNSSEGAVEINYGIAATPWLLVRPGLQYVLDPQGLQNNSLAGFRAPGDPLVIGVAGVIQF